MMKLAGFKEKPTEDAWRPGVFDHTNVQAARLAHEKCWREEANSRNKARCLGQKLLFVDRSTPESAMRDNANEDNDRYDNGQFLHSLYRQKLGDKILELAGIQETHFPSVERLEEALHQSPGVQAEGSYQALSYKAYEQVTGRSLVASAHNLARLG